MSRKQQRYLTYRQLARQLGISVSAVRGYCYDGLLRFRGRTKDSYEFLVAESGSPAVDLVRRLRARGLSVRYGRNGRLVGIVSRRALGRGIARTQT